MDKSVMTDGLKAIWIKMANFCAYQERNSAEVLKKMNQYGLDRSEKELIYSLLEEDNYINDDRYITAFIRGKFRQKKWGKVKIQYELKKKNINPSNFHEIFESEISDQEYTATLFDLLEAKLPKIKETNPYKKQQKLYAFAVNKGYESWKVGEVIKEMI